MTNQGGDVGNAGAKDAADGAPQPLGLVLMGASGAGKTTLGLALAESLGARFVDADDHHSAASLTKMSQGLGLDDDDRAPWLARLASLLAAREAPLVLACSALRQRYRNALGVGECGVRLVFLDVPGQVLGTRLEERRGHFATRNLLQSQLEALEPPSEQEALHLDGTAPLEANVARVLAWIHASRA